MKAELRHDLSYYKKDHFKKHVHFFLLPVILGPPAELNATIVARKMRLGSPMHLPLVSSQLGVVIKVLVASLAVELWVHRMLLVVVSVVEGDAREVELAVRAVGFLCNHPVDTLVVAVKCSGVYEELVAERTATIHVLAVSLVQMPTIGGFSWEDKS